VSEASPSFHGKVIAPTSCTELKHAILSEPRVLAVGNQTKPALSRTDNTTLVSLRNLQGIVEYEPSEFTFTAQAGTTLSVIVAALAERRQYLPFDPVLVESGATLGGAVASGLSGSGRFRFGGIRDFILGVEFLTGDGHTIKAGGKVVKNAAGFDIPKLLVGSCGRLGVITQITMKVFPKPVAERSLSIHCSSHAQAISRINSLACSRYELDAIDYRPDQHCIILRIGGPESANSAIAAEIHSNWGNDVSELESPSEFWRSVRELAFSGSDQSLVKIPTTPSSILGLQTQLEPDADLSCHWSAAGNTLWVSLLSEVGIERLENALTAQNCSGLVVRGAVKTPWIGVVTPFDFMRSVKQAMDPDNRFPSWLLAR
jgi:glycolate oxidase FAD binding subunit